MRVALLCILLCGCSHQPELTLLLGPRSSEGQEDVALTGMLIQRFGKHGAAGCVHQSEPTRGQPFDERREETFDTCGLGLRFGGKQK